MKEDEVFIDNEDILIKQKIIAIMLIDEISKIKRNEKFVKIYSKELGTNIRFICQVLENKKSFMILKGLCNLNAKWNIIIIRKRIGSHRFTHVLSTKHLKMIEKNAERIDEKIKNIFVIDVYKAELRKSRTGIEFCLSKINKGYYENEITKISIKMF